MGRRILTVPNALCATRLGLVPVLWWLALSGRALEVGLGVLLAGLTDALDGPIARRQKLADEFGGAFDSFADNLLVPSVFCWLLMLRPALRSEHPLLLVAWAVLYAATIGVGLVKFRRFGNLHLYSSKPAAVAQYAFVVHALLFGGYNELLLFVGAGLGMAATTETLLLQLTRSAVDSRQRSILLPPRPPSDR